jgi:hypothetical protein
MYKLFYQINGTVRDKRHVKKAALAFADLWEYTIAARKYVKKHPKSKVNIVGLKNNKEIITIEIRHDIIAIN